MTKEKHSALKALTCAAMALPGMAVQQTVAGAAPDAHSLSFRHSSYTEAELEGAAGLSERYTIGVQQLKAAGPLSDSEGYSLVITNESMSGASPMFVSPDADGKPVVTMSGATIEEKRVAGNVGMDFYTDSSKAGISLGHSRENDYSSISGGVSHSTYFNNNSTSFDMGAGLSFDAITPTDAELYKRPVSETKQSLNASIGFSHAVNRRWLIGSGFSTAVFNGYLSDPYKKAAVNEGTAENPVYVASLDDSRPDNRIQVAWNIQSRYFVDSANAALHADYGYFETNWGTRSHTVNLAWYQNIGRWQLTPRLRFYQQSAANFFKNYYPERRADGYYSSDYRLSEFYAVSGRLSLTREFEKVRLYGMYESYSANSNNDDPLRGKSPALLDYSYYSVGLDFKF